MTNEKTTAVAGESLDLSFAWREGREAHVESLPVRGTLPGWLRGSLLRTGPAKFEVGGREVRHWFDGLAMLHRFSFDEGEVGYASRFLGSRAYRAAEEKGQLAYSEFATDPCRAFFGRVAALFSPEALTDNANVNVAELEGRMIAMSETPLPVEFDAETLAAAGVPYRAPGHFTTAHPHYERRSGAMLNYAVKLGPLSSYRFFELGADGEPRVLASWPVARPAYMHSFGLTEQYLVLVEFPLVVNPATLLLAGRPYIENYRWRPERGTRISLVDRVSGAVAHRFRTDPCFAFHHVNAFEEGGRVHVDLVAFEDATAIDWLYMERLRSAPSVPRATLTRFSLDLASGAVETEVLCEDNLELPRINYGRCNGRPYRWVWGVGAGDSGFFDHVVKVDVGDGSSRSWAETNCYPGEPVFVPRPDAAEDPDAEDAGVLLSIVLDAGTKGSFLLVLDATDLSELARVEAPGLIPFGFHGQFV